MALITIYVTLQTNKMKIKSILFYSVLVYIFSSCENKMKQTIEQQNIDRNELSIEAEIKKIPFSKMATITYDNCEYLIYKEELDANEAMGFMAHKGNCKNPIHCKTK